MAASSTASPFRLAGAGAPLLALRSVRVDVGRRSILRPTTLALAPGEWLALLGPNGAGKTTLLSAVASLIPHQGEIAFQGKAIGADAAEYRRRVGLVMHETLLYRELTALENLVFYARLYGLERPNARAEAGLEDVGLSLYRHERVGRFSRGMLQRLAVARALLHSPDLLLIDEPLSGVDAQGQRRIVSLFEAAKHRGAAAIWVTHRWERAWDLADRVVEMSRGQIERITSTKEVGKDAWRPLHAPEELPIG